jgi:CubicO group peptidase (beta-lactamase class C family)
MTSDHVGPVPALRGTITIFPAMASATVMALRCAPIRKCQPPPPGSIGELNWDSGSGTYFGIDPKLDMIYILLEQTQNERGRIAPAFKKLVYDAFATAD